MAVAVAIAAQSSKKVYCWLLNGPCFRTDLPALLRPQVWHPSRVVSTVSKQSSLRDRDRPRVVVIKDGPGLVDHVLLGDTDVEPWTGCTVQATTGCAVLRMSQG